MKLLAVEEARARMLAAVSPLGFERVALDDALGRVLAADVVADRDQPPFFASAMDGWAVRAADGAGQRWIIGESAAGRGFAGELTPDGAVRIFTGAALPTGADAVVIQEEANPDGDRVTLPQTIAGRHVRPPGQDFRAGERLLTAGERLDPWRLTLAAAAGAGTLLVRRRPRVAILATGDELAAPGATPGPFQIFDSGSIALTALARSWGAEARALPRAGDDVTAIASVVGEARCDLLVVVGGASVGDHDLAKPALAGLGLALRVESVAVRPGKPTWFGLLGDGCPVLGLPGNPASALVCAELFLRPLSRALEGADPAAPMIAARAAQPVQANGGREQWLRGWLDHDADATARVTPFADQDSALVRVFAASNALIRRRPGAGAGAVGDLLDVLSLTRG